MRAAPARTTNVRSRRFVARRGSPRRVRRALCSASRAHRSARIAPAPIRRRAHRRRSRNNGDASREARGAGSSRRSVARNSRRRGCRASERSAGFPERREAGPRRRSREGGRRSRAPPTRTRDVACPGRYERRFPTSSSVRALGASPRSGRSPRLAGRCWGLVLTVQPVESLAWPRRSRKVRALCPIGHRRRAPNSTRLERFLIRSGM